MKSTHLITSLIVLIVFGCTSTSTQSEQVAEETKLDTITAICVLDNLSVRAVPSNEGKWLTSISVGEAVSYLGVDSITMEGKKERTYAQVMLAGGKTGWTRKDLIVPDGKVAVFLAENTVYKRPDLLTKTDKAFSAMDIVAIKSRQEDWMEVVGKRTGEEWIETGWVKGTNLSQDAIDVAVAKFGGKAVAQKDETKKTEMIQEILSNTDFSGSKFIPTLQEMLDAQTEVVEEAVEEVMETDTTSEES